jgi:phage gpG-like protein
MSDFLRTLDNLSKTFNKLPAKMGAEAVLFSKERFRQQNWVDDSTKQWKLDKKNVRSRKTRKRGILIKSGRLMRSVRKIHVSRNTIVIGTDVPYAKAHNEGFKGKVKVKAHTRGKYQKEKEGTGVYSTRTRKERSRTVTKKTGKVKVKAHTKTLKIRQNQFLGNSAQLAKRIERLAQAEINRALKK